MRRIYESKTDPSRLLPRLKRLDRWVCYEEVIEDGERRKKPVRIDDGQVQWISYRDIEEWHSYEEAKRIESEHDEIQGIQTVITQEGDDFVVFDIDDCIDPETKEIDPTAWSFIRRADTYAEISQSGTGVHLIFRGDIENQGWTATDDEISGELYNKYLIVVTEQHIAGTPFIAKPNEELLTNIEEKYDIDWREKLYDSNYGR